MKPISLDLENFGPYQQERIDFTRFDEAPLFLISGKTGAGKTTIFDGMTFALFGETTGGIRQGKEMRSNFAPLSATTGVTFRFSHQGLIYEIARQPEQEVAKRVGTGTTVRPAKVTLTIFAESGTELKQLTKAGEVRDFIEELLHLNAQQFTQIVLLPQGDFRKFLNADSNEKEIVLRKLFKTTIYRELAEALKVKRKEFQAETAQAEAQIKVLLEQLQWQGEFVERQAELSGVEEKLALLATQAQTEQAEQARLQALIGEVREQQTIKEAHLQQLEQLAELFKEAARFQVEAERLAESATEVAHDEAHLASLQWLARQESLLLRYQESQTQREHLAKLLHETEASLTAVTAELTETSQALAVLLEQKDSIQGQEAQLRELAHVRPLLTEQTRLQALLRSQTAAEQALATEVRAQAATLTTAEASRPALEAQVEELPQVLKTREQVTQALLTQQMWLERSQAAVKLSQELSATEQQQDAQAEVLAAASDSVTAAELTLATAKSQWASYQIARLSLDLLPGQACPVCGATEHPRPHADLAVSMAAIKLAEVEMEQAEAALLQTQKKVTQQEEQRVYLINENTRQSRLLAEAADWLQTTLAQAELGPDFATSVSQQDWSDVSTQLLAQAEVLTSRQASLNAEITAGETARSQLATLASQLLTLTAELADLQGAHGRAAQEQLKTTTRLEQLAQQIPATWTDLTQLEASAAQLEAAVADWQEQQSALHSQQETLGNQRLVLTTKVSHYQEEAANTQTRFEELTLQLEAAIHAHTEAVTIETLLTRLPDLANLTTLTERIAAYKEAQHTLVVKRQQVAEKIAARPQPDLAPVIAAIMALKETIMTLERELFQWEAQAAHNQQLGGQLRTAYQTLGARWQTALELNQLAEVANGDGPYNKKSLERYVLQAYFEEILRVANGRLLQLTAQRYSFELNDQQGSYKSQTGLEINVYDDNVGDVRSVNTLSGGESFIAALALSLSLAEVVQAQTGGVQIDALFIDEGFGALDEEALEVALEALELVEGRGRMIGIISHVSELKRRIPQQLQVISTGTGVSQITYQTELE